MVRSMVAGVAGLKAHQSKLDVIGNNIANVNTWGFKSYSYNFKDAMYTNSINSTGGSVIAGAAGGHNASQVGYGSTVSSISNVFTTGAPSPSSRTMDCMIDGTGFFLVGNMVNGTFTDIESSGLFLSRVGIFSVDNNGYLVDDMGSYVYGYAVQEETGIPEKPATAAEYTITDATVGIAGPDNTFTPPRYTVKIGDVEVTTTQTDFKDQIQDWLTTVSGKVDPEAEQAKDPTTGKPLVDADGKPQWVPGKEPKWDFSEYSIALNRYQDPKSDGTADGTVTLTITKKSTGPEKLTNGVLTGSQLEAHFTGLYQQTNEGNDREAGIAAVYPDTLSAIRIPIDPDTGVRYEIQSWKINEDGTIMGTDKQNRAIPIGQLALAIVENPNGLEKADGYYYTIGANAGESQALKPNGGPAGIIKSGWLEMANVDLANEFSNMITTQRGFQANSKIITVTDEMLQELVNMKR